MHNRRDNPRRRTRHPDAFRARQGAARARRRADARCARCARSPASRPTPLCIVVGHQAREVEALARAAIPNANLAFAMQSEQRGTGHAARCGMAALPRDFAGDVLITYGDLPMLSPATLTAFRAAHRAAASRFRSSRVTLADPGVVRTRDSRCAWRGDCHRRSARRSARAARHQRNQYRRLLRRCGFFARGARCARPNNVQGEYYLTDIVGLARGRGMRILGWRAADAAEFAGINSREELASMEAEIRDATNRKLMAAGVTFIDPATAYIAEQRGNRRRHRHRSQRADSRARVKSDAASASRAPHGSRMSLSAIDATSSWACAPRNATSAPIPT